MGLGPSNYFGHVAYLMVPYLIWVTIAMRLNWETLVLNPGAY